MTVVVVLVRVVIIITITRVIILINFYKWLDYNIRGWRHLENEQEECGTTVTESGNEGVRHEVKRTEGNQYMLENADEGNCKYDLVDAVTVNVADNLNKKLRKRAQKYCAIKCVMWTLKCHKM